MSRMGLYVLSLWLLGAALYSLNTALFFNAVDTFSDGSKSEALTSRGEPAKKQVKAERTPKPNAEAPAVAEQAANPGPTPVPNTTEQSATEQATIPQTGDQTAIAEASPPAPPSAPDVGDRDATMPPSARDQFDANINRDEPTLAETAPEAEATPGTTPDQAQGLAEVRSGVNMRAGPSTDDPVIAVQRRGAELEVLSRNGGWVRVRDGATGETGWIYQSYLGSVDDQQGATESTPPPQEQARAETREVKTSEKTAERENKAEKTARAEPSRRAVDDRPAPKRVAPERAQHRQPPADSIPAERAQPPASESVPPQTAERAPFPLLGFLFPRPQVDRAPPPPNAVPLDDDAPARPRRDINRFWGDVSRGDS